MRVMRINLLLRLYIIGLSVAPFPVPFPVISTGFPCLSLVTAGYLWLSLVTSRLFYLAATTDDFTYIGIVHNQGKPRITKKFLSISKKFKWKIEIAKIDNF